MTNPTEARLMEFPGEENVLRNVLARIEAEPARVYTNENGEVTAINPAFSNLCGYSFEEVRGKKPASFLQGPGTSPEGIATLRAAIQTHTPCVTELLNYHKNMTPYRVRIELTPCFDASSALTGFMAAEWKLS